MAPSCPFGKSKDWFYCPWMSEDVHVCDLMEVNQPGLVNWQNNENLK